MSAINPGPTPIPLPNPPVPIQPIGGATPVPISSIVNYTAIQPPPSACVYGEMRYGTNGSDGGAPELLLGNNASDATTGRITWDESDGAFDTGLVAFDMTLPPGGGASAKDTLAVTGAVTDPIYYGNATYGTIVSVVVVAGVQINGSAAVSNLAVQFYKDGTLQETFNLASGPSVDTTSAANPVAEQVLTITPGLSDNDQLLVSANLRLQAPDGSYPNVDDLFVQVFVQTSSCSA